MVKCITKYDGPEELMAMYNRDSIQMRPGTENTPDRRQGWYHGQMAMTTGVDIAFGQLMEKLRQLKLDKKYNRGFHFRSWRYA